MTSQEMPEPTPDRITETVNLVREWLATARTVRVDSSAKQLADLLRDPRGLSFTVAFIDGVIRPEDPSVGAKTLVELADDIPKFVPVHLRAAMKSGAAAAKSTPGAVIPMVRKSLRKLVSHLVIDARDDQMTTSIAKLRRNGIRLNMNLLGDAVLGADEADRRLSRTHQLLECPDVDYVSIKVSSTVAPHSPWAFDESVDRIVESLKPLFHRAAAHRPAKFINLDMEEYRDLDLTIAVFTRILDIEGFEDLEAGIVLQTYLPDALGAMMHLQQWSAARVARGGAPIKVRVVKGANLPMERVEADQHDWPLVTWSSKQETDASYLSVLDYALRPERTKNVHLGIAGQNLFHVAWAWLLASERGVTDAIDVEMLLGMAPGQAEAVRRTVGTLLLYTPIVHPGEFDVAIAYLIRRLEEGAGTDNFMSAVFELDRDEELFNREFARFSAALDQMFTEPPAPRRTQNRLEENLELPASFANTADSDPALPANREWARQIWAATPDSTLGVELTEHTTYDTFELVEEELDRALDAAPDWAERGAHARADILRHAASVLAERRGDLVEVMASECGKTIAEADPEVSEAIDFALWYADCALELEDVDGASFTPVSLTAVVPPWNFPVAIAAGSTLAALAAGSAVVIKPAPQARRCSAVMVQALWDAGVPEDVLRLVNVEENEVGQALICDPRIDRMVLTGSFDTAEMFKTWRPDLQLLGETSGKNSIIVTPSADIDLAVKDIVKSAFGHAGQKCSAGSLAILVGPMAKSERFRRQLVDAVQSLKVGPAWAPDTAMGPLIEPPSGKLLGGLTTLDPGEKWLVEPQQISETMWTPGVRDGVAAGSPFHQTEYFGPLLGIMTAPDLETAIALQNGTEYGLTAGLHSLDDSEISYWLEHAQAGNLYVNRHITGAIVRRQPFGGWKKSVVGPSSKAGGPNYLTALGDWNWERSRSSVVAKADTLDLISRLSTMFTIPEEEQVAIRRAAFSDAAAWQDRFSSARDVSRMASERNLLRYVRADTTIRLASAGVLSSFVRVLAAAHLVGPGLVSVPNAAVADALAGEEFEVEIASDDVWLSSLAYGPSTRVRLIGMDARTVSAAIGPRPDIALFDQPVTESGWIELLPFLREQAISITAHRFGTPRQVPTV